MTSPAPRLIHNRFDINFSVWERWFGPRMTHQKQCLAYDKMRAEIAKLLAETKQINVNTFLAPALAAAALMGGTAALVKLFF